MARHEDMEMIVKKVYTHRSIERGPWYVLLVEGDTWGSIRVGQEREERKKEGDRGNSLYCCFKARLVKHI